MSSRHLIGAALAMTLGLVSTPALAQQASITIETGARQVQLGQRFRIRVRTDVQGSSSTGNFSPPDLGAFRIVGQQVRRPMSVSFGTGRGAPVVSAQTVYDFDLVPTREGQFEIGPASLSVGGQTVRSNTISIRVVGDGASGGTAGQAPPPSGATGGKPPPGQPSGQPAPRAGPQEVPVPEAGPLDPQGFVFAHVDQTNPYVGEQVTLTVYLFSADPLSANPTFTREPNADGFWVQDLLPVQREIGTQRRNVEGRSYYVYKLRQLALFPLEAGPLSIGETAVQWQSGRGVFGLFNSRPAQRLERRSEPVALEVRPHPGGAPSDDVVVADLTLDAELDRRVTTTGDAVTLTLQISGRGNLRSYQPRLEEIDGLRVLDPRVDDQVQVVDGLVGGRRRYEWLIIPERPGTYDLGTFRAALLDPGSGRYALVESDPVIIEATGEDLSEDPAAEAEEEAMPPPRAPDFGPLRRESALRRRELPLSASPFFPLGVVGIPLLFALGLGFRSFGRRRAERATLPDPHTHITEAVGKRKAGDTRAFYAALEAALRLAATNAIGENSVGMTRPELEKALVRAGAPGETVKAILAELENCDFARFSSGGAATPETDASLARVRRIVKELA